MSNNNEKSISLSPDNPVSNISENIDINDTNKKEDKLSEVSLDKIIVVDDPNAPDELEEDNLQLLTDIENELEEEEQENSN